MSCTRQIFYTRRSVKAQRSLLKHSSPLYSHIQCSVIPVNDGVDGLHSAHSLTRSLAQDGFARVANARRQDVDALDLFALDVQAHAVFGARGSNERSDGRVGRGARAERFVYGVLERLGFPDASLGVLRLDFRSIRDDNLRLSTR